MWPLPWTSRLRSRLPLLASLPLLAGACAGGGDFVALTGDFADYRSWERFDVPGPTTDDGHLTGPRQVWLNARPPAGATSFPVGTIIVKTAGSGDDPTAWTILGRARRDGGAYNADGAPGWEWFGLQADDAGRLAISWRGADAPEGVYLSLVDDTGAPPITSGDCNSCHALFGDNDTVATPALDLSVLGQGG